MSFSNTKRSRRYSVDTLATSRKKVRAKALRFDALEDRIVLSTITWNNAVNPAGGSWDAPNNWIGGVVPKAGDDAVINLANTGSILLNSGVAESVKSVTTNSTTTLSISSGSLTVSAASTLSGPFNIGGGTVGGPGQLTLANQTSWTAGTITGLVTNTGTMTSGFGSAKTFSGTFTNSGTFSTQESLYTGANGTTINNQSGGTFNIGLNSALLNTDNITNTVHTGISFNNAGTLQKSSGSGTSTFLYPLNDGGTIKVAAGTLSLQQGGTFTGTAATLTEASGTILDIHGGTFSAAAGTVVTGTGAGVVQLSGATLTTAGTIAFVNYTQSSGTLAGAGTVATSGQFNWSGGIISAATQNNGTLTVSPGNTKYLNAALTNAGSAVLTDSINTSINGSTITNASGATFDIQANAALSNFDPGASVHRTGQVFNNAGTLKKSSGTGTSEIDYALNNSGAISAQAGTLGFYSGAVFTGTTSTLAVSSGALLDLHAGSFTSGSGVTIAESGAGSVTLTGGTVSFDGTTTFVNFAESGGSFTTPLTVTGQFNWTGGILGGAVQSNGTLTVSPGNTKYLNAALTNTGSAVLTDFINTGIDGTTITNASGATFDIQANAALSNFDPGASVHHTGQTLNNAGTLKKSAGTGTSEIDYTLNNSGAVVSQAGTLAFYSGGDFSGTASTLAVSSGALLDLHAGSFTSDPGATIAESGAGSVTLSGGSVNFSGTTTFVNFAESGGSFNSPLTVTGQFNWTGGILGGAVQSNGTLTVSPGNTKYLNAALTNNGSAVLTDFINTGIDGTTITNASSATIDIQANAALSNFDPGASVHHTGQTLINAGMLKKSAGTGSSEIDYTLNNSGAVSAQAGTLAFYSGADFSGTASTLAVSSGAILDLHAGSFTSDPGATIAESGAGMVTLSGGTVNFSGTTTFANFGENDGSFNSPLTVTGQFNWNGGVLGGAVQTSGTTKIALGDTKYLNATLTNLGSLALTDTINTGIDGTTIKNQSTGTFDIQNNSGLSNFDPGAAVTHTGLTFINSGTFKKSAGTGTAEIDYLVTNNGTLNVAAGTINLAGGLTNFDAPSSTLNGGIFAVTGTLEFPNANIATNKSSITLSGPASAIVDSSSNNALAGFISDASGSSFTIQNGRIFNISATFTNSGTLTIGNGSTFHATGNFNNLAPGQMLLSGGTLTSDAGNVNINSGSTLYGSGKINGNLNNAGGIHPGFASTAIITVSGNFTQTAGGSLYIKIGGATAGTQYDRIAVGGVATLNGLLNVSDLNSYVPAGGTLFRPLTFASKAGDFSSETGLDLGTAVLYPSYDSTSLILTPNDRPVTTPPSPVLSPDGLANFSLTATDAESDPSTLIFTITSLPASGTLYGPDGSPITLGETFTGSPFALSYQIPTFIFGNFADSFQYTVTDTGAPAGTASDATTTAPQTVNLNVASSTGIAVLGGTSGNDTIVVGSSGGNLQYTLNGVVTTTSVPLSSITQLNVYSRAGNDAITSNALGVNTSLNGQTGTNTLVINGTTGADVFTVNSASVGLGGATITGDGTLNVAGLAGNDVFNIVAGGANVNLNGGDDDDTFTFSDGASLTGSIDGGAGNNTIDDSAYSTSVGVNLASSAATGIGGGFANVGTFIGGTGSNTLAGPSASTTYSISGSNAVSIAGTGTFTNFGSLLGGSGDDVFSFADAATLSGSIDGGAGNNTIDDSVYSTSLALNFATSSVTGLGGSFVNIKSFLGGTASNTLTGPTGGTTYAVSGANAGALPGIASFTKYANLIGGAGNDYFKFSSGSSVSGSIDGGAGVNTLDESLFTTAVAVNLAAGTATAVGGSFADFQNLIGGSAASSLTGPAAGTVYLITSANAGSFGSFTFSKFGTITGGAGNDTFKLSNGATLSGNVDGGGGSNAINESGVTSVVNLKFPISRISNINGTFANVKSFTGGTGANILTGPTTGATYQIIGADTGALVGIASFANFGSLIGGTASDYFKISNGASLSGSLAGGGGTDTLDETLFTTPVNINIAAGTATAIGTTFSAIQAFKGGTGANTLTGPAAASTFAVTAANSGTIGTTTFSAFGTLIGGANNDVFKIYNGASLSGSVDGGGGSNGIDESLYTTTTNLNFLTSKFDHVGGTFANIKNFNGGTGTNTLTGPNAGQTYAISGQNVGAMVGLAAFYRFGTIIAGSGNDFFKINAGASISGTIDGGGGINTLDESLFTTPMNLNLATSTMSAIGGFLDMQRFVGGSSTSTLTGPATGTIFNITGNNAETVNGLTITSFNSLVGGAGNDDFVFAKAASITGTLNGGAGFNDLDLSAYTTAVTVNLATNSSTGVGSTLTNIRDVKGGSGNDAITGNNAGNILIGGAGTDVITGGSGRNILIGDAGSDTLNGGSADDILINGTTSFDSNFAALDSILAEWQSSNSYATRIGNIKNGGGLNGTNKLIWTSTVLDDNAVDVLTGNAGTDWFFKGTGDTADNGAGETVN